MVQDSAGLRPHLAALDCHPVDPAVHVLDGGQCSIGRGEGCTIRVQRDGVSRQHALVTRHEDAFHITDQRSSWGTYVNGERITPLEPYRLTANALIGLGSAKPILRFCDPDPTRPPQELAAAPAPILVHDPSHQRFVLHGETLELPFLAYQLLAHLYRNYGTICRANSCIHAVWEIDEHSADELADRLYRLMSELRLAIETHQQQVERSRWVSIESHRRRGYALIIPDKPPAS